ncbi:heme lyase CcmF/NrfE family subunit, partial [Piscinibacter sp.]|uniref:heme lyase CcmF/NrfE family subunit n=1 Tax=Piscinibacter sp. TaxID=1903157 RepID=UPI003559B767
MTPELGHLALILALLVALTQGVLPIVGAQRGNAAWIALARPAAQTQFVLVAFAFGCLTSAFLANDFSVAYVAQHSNSKLPTVYRAAAVWGGHEGSLLLWLLMLNGWTLAVSFFSRQLPQSMVARVIGVLGLVAAGFLMFILLTSNPFERLLPAAADGQDLNPLLQDPGLVFHPPMLYMGYVGFSVAFSFALAALLAGRLDAAWARWSRPWTTVAWIFLTLGIALGSWWAYYELGWVGWWFWDPVENASFMPWLVGTALIHSLAVTEKRGSFKNWTVLLAIGAFSLSLLGTFLVRSGVLTSVHAFASDPRRGIFILLFLVIVIGGSLTLFAWRAPKVSLGGSFALLSRETLLLVNNVLLVVASGSVLLGTLYPLIIDALGLGKLSVGPPYFNSVFVPIMVPLLFLVAVGPLARWKQLDARDMAQRLRIAAVIALVAGAGLPWLMGGWTPLVGLGMLLAAWIVASTVFQIRERLKAGRPARSFWGMSLAHVGVAVFVVGVTLVKGYEVEKDVRMAVGDTLNIGGYTVRLLGVNEVMGPNYRAMRGDIELSKDASVLRHLYPEKRNYFSSEMPMTETAIDSGFTRDVYVSLGEPLDGNGA